jgi:nucleotide-binding universal stress UspA family protein
MFNKIMVAYDGSAGADAALARGLEVASEAGKELWLVSVQADQGFTPPQASLVPRPDVEAATQREQQYLARVHGAAAEAAARAGITLHAETVAGNVAKCIVEYAAAGAFDLLVIGQSGHSGVWGTFLGTTADKVVRHAPCSVLVVRSSGAQPAAAPASVVGAAAGLDAQLALGNERGPYPGT